MPAPPVIGLDVGGANTKAAAVDGDGRVRIVSEPFEVWRTPERLADAIASVVGQLGLDHAPVALTTTAELVDVFPSKRVGVLSVLDAVATALPGRSLRVMTTSGALVEMERARADPLACAAANWVATALLVGRSLPDAIFVDCGGTTTDVIPIAAGRLAARGRTDVERLLAGELVYTAALRTNIAAIVSEVPIGGRPCPVSSELFAISADAHLLRGDLTEAQCTCSFPDDRGPGAEHVRARLARVVCADPEQLAPGDLEAIAAAVAEAQVAAIAHALARVAARSRLRPPSPCRSSRSASGRSLHARRRPAVALSCSAMRECRSPGRLEMWPPVSRCQCWAVTEPTPARGLANRPPYPGSIRQPSPPVVVVKIGGGLLRARGLAGLRAACDEVVAQASRRRVLVLPGGGPFADAVRVADRDRELGDRLAHRLALAAMDQLGMVLRELLPSAETISSLRAPTGLGLLLAASAFAGRAGVPESWTVTSDSLAVLAAGAIGADQAILLKPVDGVFERWPAGPPAQRPLAQPTARELRARQRAGQGRAVDPYLPDAIEQTGVTVIVRAPGAPGAPGTPATPAHPTRRRPPARGSRLADGDAAQLSNGRGDELGLQRCPRSPPRQTAERTPTMSASTRPS